MTQESANATAQEVAAFRERVLRKLTYSVGKDPENASDYDWFHAVALATRDSTIDRWMDCTREAYIGGQKRVYYLSLEFLIGRLMTNSLANLGVMQAVGEALDGLVIRGSFPALMLSPVNFDALYAQELQRQQEELFAASKARFEAAN